MIAPIERALRSTAALLAAVLLGETARAAPAPIVDPGDLADLSLEELMDVRVDTVYSASKFEQKVTQAPASVTVVSADQIRKSGYRSLAEILRSIRGLYVANDRNYSYLGARGFLRPGDYNSRMLVLVDGHRMNDNVYDSAFVGRESMVDVDQIERVEFIRGPSSSIYGSSAFFGVVNVITRSGQSLGATEALLAAGSFDTWEEGLRHGRLFGNGADLAVSVSNYSSAGQRRLYYPEFDQRISGNPEAAGDGVATDSDHEDVQNLYARASYREWTLAGFASSRDKQIPTASYGTVFNQGSERTRDRRVYLDLKYDHAFSPRLSVLARTSYDRYSYYGDYSYNDAAAGEAPDIVPNEDEAAGAWFASEVQLTGRLLDRHTLLIGAEYRDNLTQDQVNYNTGTPGPYILEERHSGQVLGLYAQGEFTLSRQLTLNAGVRYDEYRGSFGGSLNPRLGLILSPSPDITFKALYGQAFRAPNAYERFYFPVQQGASTLIPETIRTYELAAEHYLGKSHRLALSVYRYTVHNLITQTTTADDEIVFENRDHVHSQGVELEAEGKYPRGFEARASYALQKSEDGATGMQLSSSPRHLAQLRLVAPLYLDRAFAALELQYRGSVSTPGGARAEDALLTNLNLSARDLVTGLDLSVGAYNLFDERYGDPGAEEHAQDVIQQDGRSVRLKVTYRF